MGDDVDSIAYSSGFFVECRRSHLLQYLIQGFVKKALFFYICFCCNRIGLGTHLFVKIPRPGDSEGTFSVFESSCHLLLPV